jgi:hypothetical protein
MTRTEVYSTLKKNHPDATNIYKNQFGEWEVDIEEEYEVVTLTYKVVESDLRFISEDRFFHCC